MITIQTQNTITQNCTQNQITQDKTTGNTVEENWKNRHNGYNVYILKPYPNPNVKLVLLAGVFICLSKGSKRVNV